MAIARVEAIVYDLGGVLLEVDFARVTARWAELAGVDARGLAARFSMGAAYQAHERGEIDAAAYFAAMRSELDLALDDAAFADGWNAIFGPLIEPTVALVHQLAARMPQYVFSNTNAMHHEWWASHHAGALAPMREHFVSHRMGSRKPERAAFEHVARSIGVRPANILFFDDTQANVEGARQAGLQAVWVRSPGDVAGALAPWLGETRPVS